MLDYFNQMKGRANTARALRDVGGLEGGQVELGQAGDPTGADIPKPYMPDPNEGAQRGMMLGGMMGGGGANQFDFDSTGAQSGAPYMQSGPKPPVSQGAFQTQPMNASQFAVTPQDKMKLMFNRWQGGS